MQAPELLTNVRPGGVEVGHGDARGGVRPVVGDVSVYEKVVPGVTLAGPVFVIRTSARSLIGAGPPNSDVLLVPPGSVAVAVKTLPAGNPGRGRGMTKLKRSVVSLP